MARDIFTEDPDDYGDAIEVGGDAPPARQAAGPSAASEAAPAGPVSLRAQWDQQGRCWVAQFQGGEQAEDWRPPTKAEWDALRDRGTLTRAAAGNPLAPASVPPVNGLAGVVDTVKSNAVPVGIGILLALAAVKFVKPVRKAVTGNEWSDSSDEVDEETEV